MKLNLPAAHPELVARPRLMERLTAGISYKLTLVSAPAGYGKTTLLSAWAVDCGLRVAWLSLDENDNDPARFLAYLAAAVQTVGVNPEHSALQPFLGTPQSLQLIRIEDFIPVLIDQLDSFEKPFVLVLEDYHVIHNSEIHKAVAFLIDYQPPHMHLVITTREDPPLPISRLRARRQLNELRQADLRFNLAETAAFLSQWGSVELPSSDVAVLAGRTEGWVAGLQMATLALQRALASQEHFIQNRENLSRLVSSFGGGHEYLVDYFGAEVFAQQPEAVKTFLLQTSILDQLCGPLCEAVTGQSDGQPMLDRLQKANLFVISLDQERCWYRYHNLFRDLLRKQVQHQTPGLLPELHRRASQWYEERQMIDDAFRHAQAAGDQEKIGWILDEYSEVLWMRGEYFTLLHRIEALTPGQLQARPELSLGKAIILSTNGYFDEAAALLSEIDRTLTQEICADDRRNWYCGLDAFRQPQHLLAITFVAHAQVAYLREDPQTSLSYARRALDLLSEFEMTPDIPWECQVLITMGEAHLLTGDLEAAIEALAKAIPLGKVYHHYALTLDALTKQAIVYWLQSDLNQAAQVCQSGLAYMEENNLGSMPISAGLFVVWGWVQTERAELSGALECLQRGLQLSQLGSQPLFQYFAYAGLLRFYLGTGNLKIAGTFAHLAEQFAEKVRIPAWLGAILNGAKYLLWLKQGKLAETEQALRARGIHLESQIVYPCQPLFYALARLYLASGNLTAASETLDRLLEFSQSYQQVHWIILARITRALVFLRQQNITQALNTLSMALAQAERDGRLQVFLEEGEPVARLLAEELRLHPGSLFARRVLQAFTEKAAEEQLAKVSVQPDADRGCLRQPDVSNFRERREPIRLASQNAPAAHRLLEPLSERELEILRLIADGLSNQQIAARLYLTLRTVKFHTSNIYSKLDVQSRTEAVAVARKLKLIP